MARAMRYFDQALTIDPDNAQCWLEMGLVQNARAAYGLVDYAEGFEAARAAAETALRLEPKNAAGRALLARVKLNRDRDFTGADREYSQALSIEPENTYVLQSAGYVACSLGRVDESLSIYRKLAAIDPLNALALQTVSNSAYLKGSLGEAETAIRAALEIAPEGVYRHALLALILAEQGLIANARVEAQNEPSDVWSPWATALVEIKGGHAAEARTAIHLLIEREPEGSAFQIGEILASLGEIDTSFEYLDTAIEADPGISQILFSPHLLNLRSDRRWPQLLKKIGIPEKYWPAT